MKDTVTIVPLNDGPYHVKGGARVVLPGGAELTTEDEIWLCRCGHSKDKPFCDGTHKKIGFKAREGDETAHKQA